MTNPAITEELDRMYRRADLKDAALRQTEADLRHTRAELASLRPCEQLARDLLDPERYGHAVTAEIRDAARRALGIVPSETDQPAPSFNEDAARRDALHTTRSKQ